MIHETIADLAFSVDDLTPYERNPRRGSVAAVAESLASNGQYRPIVANVGTHTGRPNEVLAGNHTWSAARKLGWNQIAVTWVDVDEDDAKKILIVDNRANDLARSDTDVIASLLGELPDLSGTGYAEKDLAKMLADDIDTAAGVATRFEVVVECDDEDAQQEVFDRLSGEGWTCRVLTL